MPRSNLKILTTLLNIPEVKVVGYTETHLTEVMMTIEAEKKKQFALDVIRKVSDCIRSIII